MRRTAFGIVPRRQTAIANLLVRTVPGPEFHQRVNPKIQMIDRQVRPNVPHLLLARALDFLHVMEVLLDRDPIGKGFVMEEPFSLQDQFSKP